MANIDIVMYPFVLIITEKYPDEHDIKKMHETPRNFKSWHQHIIQDIHSFFHKYNVHEYILGLIILHNLEVIILTYCTCLSYRGTMYHTTCKS